jgi:UDP-N-acetylglucosamine 2-epimerase (non-hydrolysing)
MAPVIRELERRPHAFDSVIITTSQHREMLKQALDAFHITPHIDLGLTHANQTLAEFTSRALMALTGVLTESPPDMLLVQGDTSTVVAAVLAAFYSGIRIAHVEAGLRSGDNRRPFPEEVNRRIASCVCDLHFAPTERARQNLLDEKIPERHIYVTGNTIVDALQMIRHDGCFDSPTLTALPWGVKRVLLVTVHRRENLGEHLRGICGALREIVERHPEVQIMIPVHLNPQVREIIFTELGRVAGITLLDPLPYPDLIEVMRRSAFILTDSGGIQEEAPSLRKPVLILRGVTERPEVVEAGFGRLVGARPGEIVAATTTLLTDRGVFDRMTSGTNPFGDGHAARRIVDALEARLQAQDPATPVVERRMGAVLGLGEPIGQEG